MSRTPLFAGVAVLLLTSAAFAQTPPQDATPPKPRDAVPQAKEPGATSGTLSEQLSRSGGVIRPPPHADPKIEAPAPNPGTPRMPVIPPPGTPGGDPNVKPK
jgi:hypothetical protein